MKYYREVQKMKDKRSAAFLKKYYLPYDSGMNPDKREYEAAVADGAAFSILPLEK